MTETVVHVTTLEQWKSVLDVWFKQGYDWSFPHDKLTEYHEKYFKQGQKFIRLSRTNKILQGNFNNDEPIEYEKFMAQQEKEMAKETYYVTQEQLDLIEYFSSNDSPLSAIYYGGGNDRILLGTNNGLEEKEESAILRYLGGDKSIEFKVKEQLYRLWRVDDYNDKNYMNFNSRKTPFYTMTKENAFKATLEEIKKWQTPAWEIEKVE